MTKNTALEELAMIALRAQITFNDAEETLKKAKSVLMDALVAAHKFNPDTKALGAVRLTITPNRFFNVDHALELVTPEVILESTVEVIDNKLLKERMTKLQIEEAMENFPIPFKLGLRPNIVDED